MAIYAADLFEDGVEVSPHIPVRGFILIKWIFRAFEAGCPTGNPSCNPSSLTGNPSCLDGTCSAAGALLVGFTPGVVWFTNRWSRWSRFFSNQQRNSEGSIAKTKSIAMITVVITNPAPAFLWTCLLIRAYSELAATTAHTLLKTTKKTVHMLQHGPRSGGISDLAHLVAYAIMQKMIAVEINPITLAAEIAGMRVFAVVVSWARTWGLSLRSQKIRISYEIRWLEKNWLIAYANLWDEHIFWSDTLRQ